MEQRRKNTKQRKKAPRVPIKTYKWEDVRRSRLRGGYPWTYLDRDPFNEEVDPEQFTMEAMRKSKSSSTLGDKASPSVDIQEISNGVSQDNIVPESSGYIVITEVPSDSDINHSTNQPRGSLTIEEQPAIEEPEILNLESAESSDNISQYLDKEEIPEAAASTNKDEQINNSENDKSKERAKSEEPKKKRKLSIDSSYSRKSLSKLGIMKKLKEASEKIKFPKLSLPNLSKTESMKKDKPKEEEKDKPAVKEKKEKQLLPHKDNKPVYIHIPLKPPEGETDEFSYLEFEEKRPVNDDKKNEDSASHSADAASSQNKTNAKEVDKESNHSEEAKKAQISPAANIDPTQRRYSENPDEIVAFEILKTQSIDLEEASKNGLEVGGDGDIFIIQNSNNATNDDVIIFMPEKEEPASSKSDLRSSQKNLSRQGSRKARAKSAEPTERKRKLSIESSHSRRSLSKLGIMKKIKDATDKMKFPKLSVSRHGSKKDLKKESSKQETEKKVPDVAKTTAKRIEAPKKDEPKYIHIPLKPPPGVTDEFSYLEFEEKKAEVQEKKEETVATKEDQGSIESPASVQTNDVQFIFLTPPSDDEILDQPDIPETPSSDNSTFFPTKIDELKKIAKDAVDEAAASKSKKKLDAVEEENVSTKTESVENISAENKEESVPLESKEKIVVDEEDGLTESTMTKQEPNIKSTEVVAEPPQEEVKPAGQIQDLKSSLKNETAPVSPVLKKKVSFKRRSRDDSKDIYEDVKASQVQEKSYKDGEPKSKLAVLGNSQSMSVDEEKSYLDEKIIKSTSLEEDYNRWSKLSDHEYEPVNPPPDCVTHIGLPKVQVVDTDQGSQHKTLSLASSTTSLERRMLGDEPESNEQYTVEEMQTQIEDKFFKKKTPQIKNIIETETVTKISHSAPKGAKQPKPKQEGPSKFQQAFKVQTDKFKNKLHGIKKPNIKMPSKPKFEKPNFKFEKPKINFASFSLPRKQSKRSLKERQFSTESNAGDSKKKIFDFSTYPRIFKKKPKDEMDSLSSNNEPQIPEFATVPRTNKRNSKKESDRWGGRDSIRISLHAEDSIEDDNNDEAEREESLERQTASHTRYNEDIDIDDAYEKENQEIHRASPFSQGYNSRWNHGSFHGEPNLDFVPDNFRSRQVTDLDSPEEGQLPHESFDSNASKDINSSESSLGIHHRGVLEEIDSDEFFLRQKGISQDNIEVGIYLNSEIREALKSPNNALSDLQRDFYDERRGSNQSLPETQTKRKSVKKPKRKKTPHVSQEQIPYDQDSENEFSHHIPPARPKRKSKKFKDFIPYQETVHVDSNEPLDANESILLRHMEPESIDYRTMYENERMEGKEQPEIKICDAYYAYYQNRNREEEYEQENDKPAAPPRKHRSLNFSEHDSILGDYNYNKEFSQDVEANKSEHEYIIPSARDAPVKPSRTLSRSSSKSANAEEAGEPPVRPARTRSRSGTRSRADSVTSEPQECVEEPCVQNICDYMGYAIIDKNIKREPPLPPPKHKKSAQSEQKFFTVPRQVVTEEPPARPVRNYSTLGPSRPPRRKPPPNMTDEEKRSIDLSQYIEIDEEPNRDLNSGEVIQKMRDRPLPAPPRPPRHKPSKTAHGGSHENLEETEISTQTEPLTDDFVCEEIKQERADSVLDSREEPRDVTTKKRLITPTQYSYEEETITHGTLVVEPLNGAKILPDSELIKERRILVEREYDDEETSEIPEDFKKLKNPQQYEHPKSAQSNAEVDVLKAQKLQVSDLDVDKLSVNELMANKIIVSEIDSGNILTSEIGSKTGSLKVGEIELPPSIVQQLFEKLQSAAQEQQSSELREEKPVSEASTVKEESEESGQKKTSTELITVETLSENVIDDDEPPRDNIDVISSVENIDIKVNVAQTDSHKVTEHENVTETEPPEPPVRSDSSIKMKNVQQNEEEIIETISQTEETDHRIEEAEEPPQRPPRQINRPKTDESECNGRSSGTFQEPEIDEEPPPRPPHPNIDYFPSQPPASFYALRAQQYVEGDIPTIPRRRRHHKPPITESSSEDISHPLPSRRRYRSPEPSIPQLTGQLIAACSTAANNTIKRLITYITNNVMQNADGQQDLHVMMVILLILIAGLILLGFGDGKTVHHHHWEFFNPPRDF